MELMYRIRIAVVCPILLLLLAEITYVIISKQQKPVLVSHISSVATTCSHLWQQIQLSILYSVLHKAA
jgi:hypothetical protein